MWRLCSFDFNHVIAILVHVSCNLCARLGHPTLIVVAETARCMPAQSIRRRTKMIQVLLFFTLKAHHVHMYLQDSGKQAPAQYHSLKQACETIYQIADIHPVNIRATLHFNLLQFKCRDDKGQEGQHSQQMKCSVPNESNPVMYAMEVKTESHNDAHCVPIYHHQHVKVPAGTRGCATGGKDGLRYNEQNGLDSIQTWAEDGDGLNIAMDRLTIHRIISDSEHDKLTQPVHGFQVSAEIEAGILAENIVVCGFAPLHKDAWNYQAMYSKHEKLALHWARDI